MAGPLGAGGMGEVYRARDQRLGREVALKILPPEFSQAPERLRRFEQEARVLAALNHPHIATLYGIEEAAGVSALILELVEGVTLEERLKSGVLSLEEALTLGRQIADAVEAAHESRIIHRDLKPANIKVTPKGVVKVLDFGLAKMLEPVFGSSLRDTDLTLGLTRQGALLGTVGYMSPEQARGESVDRGADIWAYGCVLYEMVTGVRAFEGKTASDTIAAILEREPDWTRLPPDTPPALRRLLSRCMAKDPRRRLCDMGDVRLELEEAGSPQVETVAPAGRHAPGARRLWAPASWGLAVAVGLAGLFWMSAAGDVDPPRVTRATVMLPAGEALDMRSGSAPLALSPDGRRLVYAAGPESKMQLMLRHLDSFDATAIRGTEGARYPFFSPDGEEVAFFANRRLLRVSLRGGAPVPICEVPAFHRGASWGPDGSIIFSGEAGRLTRVDAAGGQPEPLITGDPKMDAGKHSWPSFLPQGRVLMTTVDGTTLAVLRLDTGEWTTVGPGSQAQYIEPGYLLFHAPHAKEGELRAVPFDLKRLVTRGESVTVVDGVFRAENGGSAYFVVGRQTLVFAPGGHARTLVGVDRNGRRSALVDDRRGFRKPKVSPDGRLVAVTIDPRPSELWVYDLERRSGSRLSGDGHIVTKAWMPDGRRLAYDKNGDIWWRAADGSDEAQLLVSRDLAQYPSFWTSDGQTLLFAEDHPTTRLDLWQLSPTHEPEPLIVTGAQEGAPRPSPDDRWLAYMSDESGRPEVYVRPYPNVGGGKWKVSTSGGGYPVWSPDGRELFYVNGPEMMAVTVDTTRERFGAGTPKLLFSGPFETGSPDFDISPDGSTFIMVEADPDARPTQFHIVLNWLEDLKGLLSP